MSSESHSTFHIALNSKWFKVIVNGEKSIDGRVYGPVPKYNIGDTVIFSCGKETIEKQIEKVHYNSLSTDLFSVTDHKKLVRDRAGGTNEPTYYQLPEFVKHSDLSQPLSEFTVVTFHLK